MEIEGLDWPASGGNKRVWDWWELGFFDERERERKIIHFFSLGV